ncbi:L-dopachrome tautomerase yellow-f2-like [Diorhabda sublineata]|uniref:L-dopachrome tautomerase yellow-f2-like n=1 Tax=Diorhabda sublineata TaxID=1163346 RepID=UPI0024E10234|nr:L-dopachrome tautomerase yellow-f2-like [Diorhabda sublineata]
MKTLSVCVFLLSVIYVSSTGLREEFSWDRITYQWPSNGGVYGKRMRRYAAIKVVEDPNLSSSGGNIAPQGIDYNYVTNIPMGANVWKNKLFITVPRRRLGVPSTLNYVPLDSRRRHNVPLIPYPSWERNIYPDPTNSGQNFVSVYRVAVDPCDRLWFVDTGLVEVLGNVSRIRPTTLVIMDLNTDKIIHSYELPQDNLVQSSAIASITVDVTKNTCDDAFAYIPDLGGYGLIVFSLKENRSWRLSHNYFHLEPLAGEFFISGHRFQWNDGIFSTELTLPQADGYRDLYFHAMAGTHMYRVSTRILRNQTLSTRSYHGEDFKVIGDRGPNSQTSAADIHKPSGVMFLGLVNQNALGCWNIKKPLDTISIVQKDDRKMIYPCDVKVYQDKVYLITNAMPEFLYGNLNYDEVNFRVWSNTVDDAVAGTQCASETTSNMNNGSTGSSGSYASKRGRPYRS